MPSPDYATPLKRRQHKWRLVPQFCEVCGERYAPAPPSGEPDSQRRTSESALEAQGRLVSSSILFPQDEVPRSLHITCHDGEQRKYPLLTLP